MPAIADRDSVRAIKMAKLVKMNLCCFIYIVYNRWYISFTVVKVIYVVLLVFLWS
jgi:hypothetical protein